MKTEIQITLTEEMLGTASSDPKIHEEFIASKSPNAATIEEEIAAVGVQEVVNKSVTIFPRHEGKVILYDYQVKGFFKDACAALSRVPGTRSNKLKAYKKVIDGTIFVEPRHIAIEINGQMGNCQRPLRASTAQGERIALANSESIPIGTKFQCVINCLDDGAWKLVEEWLDYGALRGLGQWRNSGKGRFTWKKV